MSSPKPVRVSPLPPPNAVNSVCRRMVALLGAPNTHNYTFTVHIHRLYIGLDLRIVLQCLSNAQFITMPKRLFSYICVFISLIDTLLRALRNIAGTLLLVHWSPRCQKGRQAVGTGTHTRVPMRMRAKSVRAIDLMPITDYPLNKFSSSFDGMVKLRIQNNCHRWEKI